MEVKAGYKLTQVGVIPEDWEAVTIGDVATFSGGSQPPRSTFRFASKQGYIRLIQIRDYKTDEYATFIPELMARKRCTAEDIMIGRYGPPIFQILRGIEGAYNVALLKAIPSERIHREFFFNVLKQEKLFQLIDSRSQRSSGQTGVEMPALKGYRLSLPPFPEQRSIATVLSDMDALLRSLDQLTAKKRDLKQATMQQLLTGKKRLPGFGQGKGYQQTEIGVIPEDWNVKLLGDIFSLGNGFSFKSEYFSSNGPIVLTPGNFKLEGGLYFNNRNTKRYSGDFPESTVFENGNLLVVMTDLTPDCKLLGKPAFVDSEEKILHNQRIGKIRLLSDNFDKQFLYFTLLSSPYLKKIKDQATGSTVRHTSNKSIYSVSLPIPKQLEEQRAIANVLCDMDTELAALEQRRDKTSALKQGMMQELLTGRTRLL